MPEKTVVESKLESAAEAIESRQYARALKLAKEVREVEPDLALSWLIEGISLSRLSRTKEANVAFEKAIELNPESARYHFNYAVHLAGFDDSLKALRHAEKAIQYDPYLLEAQVLANRMRGDLGQPQLEIKGSPRQVGPFRMLKEVRMEAGDTSSMPWIDHIEPIWTIIGITIATFSLIALMILIGSSGHVIWHAMTTRTIPSDKVVLPLHGYLKVLCSVFGWIGGIGSMLFVVVDVLNKRRTFLWIPLMFFFFILGLSWLPMYGYLIFGRKSMVSMM